MKGIKGRLEGLSWKTDFSEVLAAEHHERDVRAIFRGQ
jgi:hypothetical protein